MKYSIETQNKAVAKYFTENKLATEALITQDCNVFSTAKEHSCKVHCQTECITYRKVTRPISNVAPQYVKETKAEPITPTVDDIKKVEPAPAPVVEKSEPKQNKK